jgi:hypothetical protein
MDDDKISEAPKKTDKTPEEKPGEKPKKIIISRSLEKERDRLSVVFYTKEEMDQRLGMLHGLVIGLIDFLADSGLSQGLDSRVHLDVGELGTFFKSRQNQREGKTIILTDTQL